MIGTWGYVVLVLILVGLVALDLVDPLIGIIIMIIALPITFVFNSIKSRN